FTGCARSIRTMSTPMSESSIPANGPGPMPASSTIFTPCNGPTTPSACSFRRSRHDTRHLTQVSVRHPRTHQLGTRRAYTPLDTPTACARCTQLMGTGDASVVEAEAGAGPGNAHEAAARRQRRVRGAEIVAAEADVRD